MSPENNTEPGQKRSVLAPLLTSLVLLVLIAGFSFYLWRFYFGPRLAEMAGSGPRLLIEEQHRQATLTAERDRLKLLLSLPPCEAGAKLSSSSNRSGAGIARLLRFLTKKEAGESGIPAQTR